MNANTIRAKMNELANRSPKYYPERHRDEFVEFVYREQGWVEAGPFSLSVDYWGGIREYRPLRLYLEEGDYAYFKKELDDNFIDRLELARAFINSVLALCGFQPTFLSSWAVDSLGKALPDNLSSRPPEDLAAEAIQNLFARKEALAAESQRRRRVEANPFGNWSFVRTSGGDYDLKPAAAKCFAAMVDLLDRGLPLYAPSILKAAGISEDRRLDHVFLDSGAWGKLVKSKGRKSRRLEIVW